MAYPHQQVTMPVHYFA